MNIVLPKRKWFENGTFFRLDNSEDTVTEISGDYLTSFLVRQPSNISDVLKKLKSQGKIVQEYFQILQIQHGKRTKKIVESLNLE